MNLTNNSWLKGIRGVLLDLEGTVYIGKRPLEGAVEAIQYFHSKSFPLRFATNTTTRSNQSLLAHLRSIGIPIESEELFGVIKAAVTYLKEKGKPVCHLLLSPDPKVDFSEFHTSDNNPDCIVIGDSGKDWDHKLMNDLFHMVTDGAEIVALHKGKFWQTENGLRVDIGALIAGLEYVTGKKATVVGKPSASFYQMILDDLRLPAGQVVMAGDDLYSDVGGAQAVGMRAILVRTGKFREDQLSQSKIIPDLIINSIADLPKLLLPLS